MKKILVAIFLIFSITPSFAEIIENRTKEEKNFGPWKVICERDIMMGEISCKSFAKFYNDMATVYIQPHNKYSNQVVVIIQSAAMNTVTKLKIDQNPIIKSELVTKDNYGLIPFSNRQQKHIFRQLQEGQNLYIRFFVPLAEGSDKNKEITVRLSLEEFNDMIAFYNKATGKY